MFDKIINIINEIHYTDYYPKQFVNFVKKYKDRDLNNLYVHFSNFKSDVLDKRINYDPQASHDDPAGVYGFPADYVINHPSDIGFGTNRKYLAVIENNALDETLYLQDMTKEQFIYYMDRLFPNEDWHLESVYQNYVVLRGMSAGSYLYRKLYGFFDETKRSPKDMNRLLVNAGIKVLVDNADEKSKAIIHPDEPHQVIFLTRDSFNIVETFQLREEPATGDIEHGRDKYLETNIINRMLGMLSSKLEDRFKIEGHSHNKGSFSTTIPFRGLKYEGVVNVLYPETKEHREYGNYSNIKIEIDIKKLNSTQRVRKIFSEDTKIENIISVIYNKLK